MEKRERERKIPWDIILADENEYVLQHARAPAPGDTALQEEIKQKQKHDEICRQLNERLYKFWHKFHEEGKHIKEIEEEIIDTKRESMRVCWEPKSIECWKTKLKLEHLKDQKRKHEDALVKRRLEYANFEEKVKEQCEPMY